MEEIDSTALILLPKKKHKETVKTQVESFEKKKLSKSQKRKLKKLSEEKEMKKLLSKSLEALQKYEIRQDAHSLMFSSQNISQALTMKEKRRRDMQFSKAGLEVPESDQNAKRKKVESRENNIVSHEDSSLLVSSDDATLQPIPSKRARIKYPLTFVPSQGPDHRINSGDHGGSDPNNLFKRVGSDDTCKVMRPDTENILSHHSLDSDVELVGAVDEPDGDRVDSDEVECEDGIPDPRALSTPILVHVSRPKEVEDARKDLPIVMKEQEIMEAINEDIVVLIHGETGCGKTTQVPQFLYEAGYGSTRCNMRSGVIGVTQPRRVAVFSTAKRVAYELGLRLGREVGFQVRYDKKIGENGSIKFMTDGILLGELQNDFLLKRYSVLILDEAHERSLNTDILIGMLSRVIKQRLVVFKEQRQRILGGELIRPEYRIYPLRLILMSATMRVEDFTGRIFGKVPSIIKVEGRQFPVTSHFLKKTELEDYIGVAYKKVLKIHKRLPAGGILLFVTGQREVEYLCRKLRNASRQFKSKNSNFNLANETTNDVDQIDECDIEEIIEALDTRMSSTKPQTEKLTLYDGYHDESDNDDSYHSHSSESDIEWDSESDDEDVIESINLASKDMSPLALNVNPTKGNREERGNKCGLLHVLPFYAMLPAAEQLRAFEKTKEGERLVVVATNVAETSITIPGIKYVVDSGREKVKKYNSSNGMESYEIQWISKASAAQRAGRAGRTGPGQCYHLNRYAALATFPDHSCAEILKIPVNGVVLLMKSMGIDKVANFPFPTPPDPTALAEAERCLKALEALDSEGRLTPLGKTMAQYPMSPRHSRLLLLVILISKRKTSHVQPNLVLGYALAVAAALSLPNPVDLNRTETERVFRAIGKSISILRRICLLQKTMEEMSKLRKQLLKLVFDQRYSGLEHEFSWTQGSARDVEHKWSVLSDKNPLSQIEENIICQGICAGWADRVAKRVKRTFDLEEGERKVNAVQYQSSMVKETIFLHQWSTVARSAPEFLVYNEMLQKQSNMDSEKSMPFISGVTSVESEWLVNFARNLCTFSAQLENPKPFYDPLNDQTLCYVIPYFGPHLWELPLCKVPIKDAQKRVAIFAHALLDGHVLPCLKCAKKYMSALPGNILRPEALGQKRVGNLLGKLITRSRTVDNYAMLREAWRENPRYLYSEIRDWFQEKFHSVFEELWENMCCEALSKPGERFSDQTGRTKKGHGKSN